MPTLTGPYRGPRRRFRPHQLQRGGSPPFPVFNPRAGLWITDSAPTFAPRDFTQYVVAYSPSIKNTISPYAGIFQCQLDGPAAVMATVKVEQELTWSRDGVTYAGRIRSVIPVDQVIASANRTLTVECQDFTTLLDADICAYAVSAPQINPNRAVVESDVQRIGWLLQSFGRQSVTARHVLQNYASVPATDYKGMTLKDAIKSVLAYSGGSFYVDYAKDLHCFVDERQYASFVLSETPDDVSSFAYGGLTLPSDSVDLRNAIYAIPGTTVAFALDTGTETVTAAANVTARASNIASFRGVSPGSIIPVGSPGPFTVGSNTAVSPPFGQPTKAGNLLVAWASSVDVGLITTSSPGWLVASQVSGPANLNPTTWYKPNCAANEATPTFTSATGTSPMFAQVAEFSGAPQSTAVDQINGVGDLANSSSLTTSMQASDDGLGDLVLMVTQWTLSASVTASFTEMFNNAPVAAAVHAGDSGAIARAAHSSFSYSFVFPRPTWYTDEASIALYGRREASFTDTTVDNQADLDALGAAALAENSQPRQEGSFTCWRPGLVVGQRFTIQSSLYTVPVVVDPLGNYTGIIQSVAVTYPEDERSPKFEVEFLKPKMTLAVQLGEVVASIPEPVVLPTVGSLGYKEVVADQGGIIAETDLIGLSKGVTVGTGRQVRVTGVCQLKSTVVGDAIGFLIKEGTTTLSQAQKVVSSTFAEGHRVSVVLKPSAGDHIYYLRMVRNAGTGTVTMVASDVAPASIEIEDAWPT